MANSIDVVNAGGHAGPRIPAGINLPNEQEIRENYGSKSVLLHNVMRDARGVTGGKTSEEFLETEEEKELARKSIILISSHSLSPNSHWSRMNRERYPMSRYPTLWT